MKKSTLTVFAILAMALASYEIQAGGPTDLLSEDFIFEQLINPFPEASVVRCILVRERRGTRCNSRDSLELTMTLSSSCRVDKVYYDLYSQRDSSTQMRWVQGGTVYSGKENVVHFCTEPYEYEIREK
ncbi:MAG: hypothetical protein WBO10_00995 [Pyrinomonadaceae bacterium]